MRFGLRLLFVCSIALCCCSLASDAAPAAVANDNRTPAGLLRDGVLTLHLEMRPARWFPGDNHADGVPIYAFAEEGRPAQDPGPLIRVEQGTQIHATVRNTLPVSVTVHGLHAHPGKAEDAFKLAPGEKRELSFSAGAPGTYFYWATEGKAPPPLRLSEETELTGAFVVDPKGAHPNDRIFVINLWFTNFLQPDFTESFGLNGYSWPHTERVTVTAGEPERWRIINATVSEHAMHLHGFFYSVTGVGDGEEFHPYAPGDERRVVTEHIAPAHTFEMTWLPERPGNWIFHCHMTGHMGPSTESLRGPQVAFGMQPAAQHTAAAHDAPVMVNGMQGIVLGITVLPGARAAAKSKLVPASATPPHRIHLFAGQRPAQPYSPGGASFYLEGDNPGTVGPPLVLTRGEPTEITVTNQLGEPTAVHWHGIELESYYDGVAGFGGDSPQVTPPIAPGASFVARMTPPRPGTYIYHTHWHDVVQLTGGMYGPLIVLEPGEKFDPTTDKIFVIGRGGTNEWTAPLLVNGSAQPPALLLKPGTKYRFRLINISTNDVDLAVSLRHDGNIVQWRAVGKDGAALPPNQATMQNAEQPVTVGETRDFEYVPPEFGVYEMKISAGFPLPVSVVQSMAAIPPIPSR